MGNSTNYKQIIFSISTILIIIGTSVVLASQDDIVKTPDDRPGPGRR